MSLQLYNPFENMFFNNKTCFLTGEELFNENENITVFPEWVLQHYELSNTKFTMMDNVTFFLYKDIKLPCTNLVKTAFEKLDEEIKTAFNKGYDAVKKLDTHKLFLWTGRMVYGILYHDLIIEKESKEKKNIAFTISPALKNKFSLFHLMLQSLVAPIEFGSLKPWSITVVKLKYSKEIFNYRDDTINLVFSLGTNEFGIIAMLQDNEIIKQHETPLLEKIGETILHPIQFEELKARFMYNNYLLQYKPQYQIEEKENKLVITAHPFSTTNENNLFAKWDDKMFSEVLVEYWKTWGLKKTEIVTYPNAPISFLENENTYEFINPESIELPF